MLLEKGNKKPINIIIFGGTTEGKIAAELLDYMHLKYYYSTKTESSQNVNGTMISGTKTTRDIQEFCNIYNIKLIVDAAHPFAVKLHKSIFEIAIELKIKIIRYERPTPTTDYDALKFFDSYIDLNKALEGSHYKNLLFLTGVQTIPHFTKIWQNRKAYFRILNTDLSKNKAKAYGISDNQVLPMKPNENGETLRKLALKLKTEIFISKESGNSGFFSQKLQIAKDLKIPFWAIKRPQLPDYKFIAYNKKEMLQSLYRAELRLFQDKNNLKRGFTTGTCILATSKACFLALLDKKFPTMTEITLPSHDKANYYIFPNYLYKNEASCSVIKYSGDDPDITHAIEIGCILKTSNKIGIHFLRGKGVGIVTLSGLSATVGEPAINEGPRKMISDQLNKLSEHYKVPCNFDIIPFVPEGEELAKHTFNPKVGVKGGISIVGTTGIITPYSNSAFLASIKQQLYMLKKNNCDSTIITAGMRSQKRMMEIFPTLPEYAYIHYGNSIGKTIEMAVNMKIHNIYLGLMFGKGVKLAQGNLDTHSHKVVFDPEFLAHKANLAGCPQNILDQIKKQKLANAILPLLPCDKYKSFYDDICESCYNTCKKLVPKGFNITVFLLMDNINKFPKG